MEFKQDVIGSKVSLILCRYSMFFLTFSIQCMIDYILSKLLYQNKDFLLTQLKTTYEKKLNSVKDEMPDAVSDIFNHGSSVENKHFLHQAILKH